VHPPGATPTLWSRGMRKGDHVRLRFGEEQRHKPLCFASPGERWENTLHQALPQGMLWC